MLDGVKSIARAVLSIASQLPMPNQAIFRTCGGCECNRANNYRKEKRSPDFRDTYFSIDWPFLERSICVVHLDDQIGWRVLSLFEFAAEFQVLTLTCHVEHSSLVSELIGLADEDDITPRRRELNQDLADELSIPYLPNLEAAIERTDVDLVFICSEPERRKKITIAAARGLSI
jgi:hypothetical protein